jgi:hypothetical protein
MSAGADTSASARVEDVVLGAHTLADTCADANGARVGGVARGAYATDASSDLVSVLARHDAGFAGPQGRVFAVTYQLVSAIEDGEAEGDEDAMDWDHCAQTFTSGVLSSKRNAFSLVWAAVAEHLGFTKAAEVGQGARALDKYAFTDFFSGPREDAAAAVEALFRGDDGAWDAFDFPWCTWSDAAKPGSLRVHIFNFHSHFCEDLTCAHPHHWSRNVYCCQDDRGHGRGLTIQVKPLAIDTLGVNWPTAYLE